MGTPAPVGDEFVVNSTLPGIEKNRDIISLADGSFVVLWEDINLDTASLKIFGRRFTGDGAPLGSEFRISPPSHGTAIELNGFATALAGGGYVVFWNEPELFGQRFNSDGTTAGNAFSVTNGAANLFNGGTMSAPGGAAGLQDGGFVVAWTAPDGDGAGIFFQRYLADGSPAGGPVQANVTTDKDQAVPSVAVLSDGTFTISWHSLSDTIANNGITVRQFSATGTPMTEEILVDDVGLFARTAAIEGGRYVVAWPAVDSYDEDETTLTDPTHICARIYNADGTPLGDIFSVNTTQGFCASIPSLAALDDGGFVVVWTLSDGDDYNVHGQRFSADGTPIGSEFLVHSGIEGVQFEATVTALPNSRFVVSWWDFEDGTNSDTHARTFSYDSSSQSHGPDLTGDAVQLSKTVFAAGDNFTVTFDLHNTGDEEAAPFTSGIYLSTDSTIDTSDTLLLSPNWPSLGADSTFHNVDIPITLPSDLAGGTYYIGVYADRSFQIAETNENNNATSGVAISVLSKNLTDAFAANSDTAKGLSAAYAALVGGVPNEAGFEALINAAVSTNYGAGPGPVFNEENIFINLVNNLVQGNATAQANFNALAGAGTLAEKIGSIYQAIIPPGQRTDEGLAFLTRPEGIAFYQQVAAERGVAGDNGAAIIALASLLQITVAQDIGIGNAVNDLFDAVAGGSHVLPATGSVFTDIEVADGTQFDGDDAAANAVTVASASPFVYSESAEPSKSDQSGLIGIAAYGDLEIA